MKVIIAGSRTIQDYEFVRKVVEKVIKELEWEITEVVCGKAKGVDTAGEIWALMNKIPVKYFPADWNKFGKSAGFRRNQEMVDYADALIAITTGSKGTAHTIRMSKEKGIPVYVEEV